MTIQLSWYDPEQTILHIQYSGVITSSDLEKMRQEKLNIQLHHDYYVIDDLTHTVGARDIQSLVYQTCDKTGGHLIVAAPGMLATMVRSALALAGRSKPGLTVQLVDNFDLALQKISRFKQAKNL